MRTIIKYFFLAVSMFFFLAGYAQKQTITLSKEILLDKIKGGWAGQTFGCTFGGPTEFKYNGCIIPDSVAIPWPEHYCRQWFEKDGGLYDDVYMDLTFVNMYNKYGLDVNIDVIADAFANAHYKLWHANQVARNNILNGMRPPRSGHWKNNPHADDIDFQIEADFAGLMSPGMPNSASKICDDIGHIMCYGDGWYGGVYVAAMYSLSFVSDDMSYVVKEALKTIPEKSKFYQCVNDVIGWCEQNSDWKITWQLIEDKWANEISCPKGVDDPFNIEAKINSAYVIMGLLYGNKDMEKTMNISTRCGADSDCNPATAAGILGTMLGYSHIDDKWIDNLKEVEDMNFDHTEISLNRAYQLSFEQALETIKRGGGIVTGKEVKIAMQKPESVRFEQSFEGLELIKKEKYEKRNMRTPFFYEFTGTGFVCMGQVRPLKDCPNDYVAQIEVDIDNKKEIVNMPSNFTTRRFDIYWNYELAKGSHHVAIKWLNPISKANAIIDGVLTYITK